MISSIPDAAGPQSAGELAVFRSLIPILQNHVYLNSCAKGPLCTPVRLAYEDFLRDWDEQGSPWQLWMQKADQLRASFASFIGAKPQEIGLALSVSCGTNSIASALQYARRPRVVLGDQEYPTMAQIWLAQRPLGAQVERVRSVGCYPGPDDYARAVDDRTAIVPLTHVSFRNGSTLPVKAITEVCHRRGAYVLLDDYQCTGTRPINVKELGVDFMVTGMLKYMLGPPGIAFIYVRDDLLPRLRPRMTGWFGRRDPFSLDTARTSYAPTARRFETGTFPVGAIYASLAAITVIERAGLERIQAQIARLTKRLIGPLAEMGFKVTTPPGSQGPMVASEVEDLWPLLEYLAENRIIVAGRNNLFRLSLHGFNTDEDVDALLGALRDRTGAGHSPGQC